MNSKKNLYQKLFKWFNPAPDIGGLEIDDFAVRFVSFTGNKLRQAVVALPSGTVADGQVKNRAALIAALKSLHQRLSTRIQPLDVIVTASSANVYTQLFSLPASVSEKNLAESLKLNLEMLSPFDIKSAYYDAQRLGASNDQIDYLGAFINAMIVDQFLMALTAADFNVIAFEFPALSLSRLTRQFSEINFYGSHVLINVGAEGIMFLVVARGQLYFHYFISWKTIKEEKKSMSHSDIEAVTVRELRRLINFYQTKFGKPLDDIIILAPKMLLDLRQVIKENFAQKIYIPAIELFPQLSPVWYPAFGAAVRGLTPRSEDNFISLMASGTEEQYLQSRILHFISLWRNVAIIALGFLLIAFLTADSVLMNTSRSLKEELLSKLARSDVQEVEQLQKQAQDFNRQIALMAGLKDKTANWSPLFEQLNRLMGSEVVLQRVYIDPQKRVVLSGRTKSESEAVNFKNRLLQEKNFDKVVLPLSSLQAHKDGTVSFTLTFEIKNLNF